MTRRCPHCGALLEPGRHDVYKRIDADAAYCCILQDDAWVCRYFDPREEKRHYKPVPGMFPAFGREEEARAALIIHLRANGIKTEEVAPF